MEEIIYLDVIAVFNDKGVCLPIRVKWLDGKGYKVLVYHVRSEIHNGARVKIYQCNIGGETRYLYRDRDKWYTLRRKPVKE